jgi:hypothetical protein
MESPAEIGCHSRHSGPLGYRPEMPSRRKVKHAPDVLRISRQHTAQPLRKFGWRLILIEIDTPDIRNVNAGQPRAEGG